jgi:hypothetical protein
MAKTTLIIDDIDGTPGAQEVEFSYAGTTYTIDLSEENRAALRQALNPYIEAATQVGGGRTESSSTRGSAAAAKGRPKSRAKATTKATTKAATKGATKDSSRSATPTRRRATSSRGRKAAAAGVDPTAVRSWAAENGYEVSPRGRVSKQVVEAYESAQREAAAD